MNKTITKSIVVVSGLPRSGTSLMMQMLQAGGMEIIKDDLRAADEDNPEGYFEYEPVKNLSENNDWLVNAGGKAVKIISPLLPHLPENCLYKIIFMQRNLDEIIASQNKMLERVGKATNVPVAEIKSLLKQSLLESKRSLIKSKNMKVLFISYEQVLNEPEETTRSINNFLNSKLDSRKMASVVNKNLYRNKSSDI
ncbi:MAG: sulfotransferase domain-containing protein [Calditrichaeota bacterium]|nr:sulfotransferase domain-containing protein [Calditrichota bacterium]